MIKDSLINDFRKYAIHNTKANRSVVDSYIKKFDNVYPGIVEDRPSAMRCVEMNVFSRLMHDRIIYFSGEVTQASCDVVIAQLLYLASTENRDINLYINSPGGEIVSGLGVIDTMNYIKPNVATVCVGLAASMGSVFLSNGAKGKRSLLPHSRVMIHSAAGWCVGHTADVRIEMQQLERCQKDIYEILAKNCGKTYDEIVSLCDRDNWFIGEEAIKELNIADKILLQN
jgi:ATP-dependent Clp protease protease subunit